MYIVDIFTADLIRDKQAAYKSSGIDINVGDAIEEVVADACGMVLRDNKMLFELQKSDKALWTQVKAWLGKHLGRVKTAFDGVKAELTETQEMEAVFDELQKLWTEGAVAASKVQVGAQTETSGDAKLAIKEIGNTGKYYVQADRQVLFGNDPESWGEQLTRFINNEILKGGEVAMSTADGEILRLTKTTAEKGAFRNIRTDRNGRAHLYTDEEYYAKLNAEAHIDELVSISTDKNPSSRNRADINGKHGEFASKGWRYRNAFFMDFDGTYYQLTISAAYNDSKNGVVYNVAEMKERSFPNIHGSSTESGAQGGNTSLDIIVPQSKRSVKSDAAETTVTPQELEIVYSINKISRLGNAIVSSNGNAAGSKQNTKSVGNTVPQSKRSVKSDAAYLSAVNSGDMETAQRMVDEAAKDAGYTVRAYHGTPNGTFTVFRGWQYFTRDKQYADVYQNQGASSNGYKKTADNPKTYIYAEN